MRELAIGLLAATGIAIAAVPASAEGIWIGADLVGVGVGVGPYAYDDGYYGHRYYRERDYGYYDDSCRLTTVYRHGHMTRIRHCD